MRNALLAAILLVAAACGAYNFPGGSPSGTGTVSGQVVVFPCGPVQPVAPVLRCVPVPVPIGVEIPPCAPQSAGVNKCGSPGTYAGLELAFTSGATTDSIRTDSSGNYSIELPAGTWSVNTSSYMRIVSGPRTVTVKPGASVVANYVVDSGIR